MKFTVPKDEFTAVLQTVSKVTATRSPTPVLEGVKITVRADGITMEATDLDMGIRAELKPTAVEGEGEFVVMPARLLQLMNELEDEEITLSTDEANLVLQSKGGLFKFRRLGTEDFPQFPPVGGERVEVEAGPLKEMVDRIAFCAAKEKGRYALNGVYLAFEEGALEMVATDGRRLGLCRYAREGIPAVKGGMILPVRLVELLRKELARMEADRPAALSFFEGRALFEVDGATIFGRLVMGEYPNYRAVLPTNLDKRAVFAHADFLRAARIAAIFTDPMKKAVVFTFSPGKVTMATTLPEQGESRIEIPAEYEGPETALGFNPAYLLDYLRVVGAEKIEMRFLDERVAAEFRTEDDPFGYRYVLMPMKV